MHSRPLDLVRSASRPLVLEHSEVLVAIFVVAWFDQDQFPEMFSLRFGPFRVNALDIVELVSWPS